MTKRQAKKVFVRWLQGQQYRRSTLVVAFRRASGMRVRLPREWVEGDE